MPKHMRSPDHAKQFLPFAALRGYYELIQLAEHVDEPRRTLTSDEAERLNRAISELRPNDFVEVVHYHDGAYVKTWGPLAKVLPDQKSILIANAAIQVSDIIDLTKADGPQAL